MVYWHRVMVEKGSEQHVYMLKHRIERQTYPEEASELSGLELATGPFLAQFFRNSNRMHGCGGVFRY